MPTTGRPPGDWPALGPLIRAAQRRKGNAREELAATLRVLLLKLVRRDLSERLRLCANVDPEDLAHDVLAKIERALPTLVVPSEGQVRSWIDRLVQNRIKDLNDYTFRAKKRDPRSRRPIGRARAGVGGDDDPALADPSARSPQDVAIDREVLRLCMEAVARLPTELRVVIKAIEIEGVPLAAYARTLGLPESIIRSRRARGLAMIAAAMGNGRESTRE